MGLSNRFLMRQVTRLTPQALFYRIAQKALWEESMRKIAFVLAIALLLSMVSPLAAEEDKGAEMIVDAFVLRPAGLAATIIGSCAFILSLPFSSSDKEAQKEAAYWMVERPAHYTFCRPLGEFETEY